ncbi:Zn-dependent exopeptidase [Basidiobolus meristosporus CBS 931.73]|uniref:Peptide hydrolase n=1 Tax=Basidiobolus meristosporus CBS 931.73 TaxID=1314790 RepID=A0A1Y1YIQ3_9FUNG|nr:Zn-dependent exopeptidase [Basidiobolus meristosporus CBS 931.73]|eukprot:ORX97882.1 Zn-dependent exopeptidase [Basidiobolus meristosporus CBS 931.73]
MIAPLVISTLVIVTTASEFEGTLTLSLQNRIILQGLLKHTDKLQQFACKHNGTRVSGSEGHQLTIGFVYGVVKKAGYRVTLQQFSALYYESLAQSLSANGKEFTIYAMPLIASPPRYGLLAPVALVSSAAGDNGKAGCEEGDFTGVDLKDKVALMERGCSITDKSINAKKHDAAAFIIYNNGPADFFDEVDDIDEEVLSIPTGAETKGGDPTKVIFLGAHSDSVRAGPGINDNGSGSAALLEVARQFGHTRPKNKVRFGWWSAEEFGLLGSEHYVSKLSKTDIDSIAVILNFDMIASPNYVIRVLNGDSSGQPTPAGSEVVTALFEKHFQAKDVVYESGLYPYSRSDVGPFAAVGIPSGGLDTGADELKTEEEAKKFGGKAGQPLDP